MPRDDLTAYIAAVRHITAEWELDECAEFEPDPNTLYEIRECILRLLTNAVKIYLPRGASRDELGWLVVTSREYLKPKIGSSVRLSEVLDKWVSQHLEAPMPMTRADLQLYGHIAAVAVDLACDVHQEDGIWMIGNAEWRCE